MKLIRIFIFNNLKSKSLFYLCLILVGCENYKIGDIYQQRISDSPLVIYDYFAGGLYTDSSISGYAILDSSKSFSPTKIDKLPIAYFKNAPQSDSIDAVNLVELNDEILFSLNPIRSYIIEKNIKINIEEYIKFKGTSSVNCGLTKFEFNLFKETNDSLVFYGLRNLDNKHKNNSKNRSYPKGNIKIIEHPKNIVSRIEIKELIITSGDKILYKNQSNEIDRIISDYPIICIKTYYLIPKNQVYTHEFSDFGIFKKIN